MQAFAAGWLSAACIVCCVNGFGRAASIVFDVAFKASGVEGKGRATLPRRVLGQIQVNPRRPPPSAGPSSKSSPSLSSGSVFDRCDPSRFAFNFKGFANSASCCSMLGYFAVLAAFSISIGGGGQIDRLGVVRT